MDRLEVMSSITGKLNVINLANASNWKKFILLKAVSELTRVEKGDDIKSFLKNETESSLNSLKEGNPDKIDLENYNFGIACYKLFALTKEEKYKEYAKKIASKTNIQPRTEKGYFIDNSKCECLYNAYAALPFYMEYETKDGGKEHYNDIIAQFNSIYEDLFRVTREKALSGDIHAISALSYFAAATIDTMEVMDQALYEIFAKLRGYHKDSIRALLEVYAKAESDDGFKDVINSNMSDSESKEAYKAGRLITAYAIYKGCRMNILHTEQYEKYADYLFNEGCNRIQYDNYMDNISELELSGLILAYSENVKLRDYQDYGRTRGGVLWN